MRGAKQSTSKLKMLNLANHSEIFHYQNFKFANSRHYLDSRASQRGNSHPVIRTVEGGEAEVAQTYYEKGGKTSCKNFGDGTTRKKRKNREQLHERLQGGHGSAWSIKDACGEQESLERDDMLW